MSLIETGLRAAAIMGLTAGVGCGASPRPSVSDAEAFSPLPTRQSVSNKTIVRCSALGIDIPALSESLVSEASVRDPIGLGVDGVNCRASGFAAYRTRLPEGMSVQQVMQKLLANQGVSGAHVTDGALNYSTVLSVDNGNKTGVMVFTSPDSQLVFRVVVEQNGLPTGLFNAYWNRVRTDTRLVTQ